MTSPSTSSPTPTTVVVIGAGPGGMFFCHALESYRRELKEQGGDDATRLLSQLPIVTCLERSAGPGGVWRTTDIDSDTDDTSTGSTPSMYDALWTNGPKEAIEFFDYTFDEHFGGSTTNTNTSDSSDGHYPLPIYMPRQAILEYMIGRVTKHCPNFFQQYMMFHTTVNSVHFLKERNQFEIVSTTTSTTTTSTTGNETTTTTTNTNYYDKCIWAAGMNGIPYTPPHFQDIFYNFKGNIMHSSDVSTSSNSSFEQNIHGKRLLIIGGSYSAEDLTLMAIKLGVEKVYICSRSPNVISWTSAWPYNKVEVLENQTPIGVTKEEGIIQFASSTTTTTEEEEMYNDDDADQGKEEENNDDDNDDDDDDKVQKISIQTELRNIDTIIFCTGYLPNLNMLSDELKEVMHRDEEGPSELSIPKDWKMTPNKLTPILGDISPDDDVRVTGPIYPGLYCDSISITNPQMMFMKFEYENPLFGIDINAWLLLRSVLGSSSPTTNEKKKKIPSTLLQEEMIQQEEQYALRPMNNPWHRCMIDKNYFQAIDEHWEQFPNRPESKFDLLEQLEAEYGGDDDDDDTMEIRILTRYMQQAQYPISFGSFEELNETANRYMQFDSMTYNHRAQLTQEDADNGRTFRDYTSSNANEFRSVFTGTSAIPLKQRWLDIEDAHDPNLLRLL